MIDLRYVKKVIEMLDQSSVDSIEISSDKGMKLRISKSPLQRGAAIQMAAPVAAAPAVLPPAPAARPADEGGRVGAPTVEAPRTSLLEIKSPMVGTFYSKPSPDKEDYVKIGAKVKPDSIVCKLEAMKLFNDLTAECSGIVREVCIQNGQSIDFGTVLFRVELG